MKPTYASLMTAPPSALGALDITSAEHKANPFPLYARLRDEAPVLAVTVRGRQRAWLVTRYDDAVEVLKNDARFVKNPRTAMTAEQWKKAPRIPAMLQALERNLLGLDEADHGRLKALVHQAFTPRTVERMRGQTETVTREALDRAERGRVFDLIEDFALPVPLTIIARILGVPAEDAPRFTRWTRAFVSAGTRRHPIFAVPSILRFIGYLRGLVRARRARPEDDLVSGLARAQEGDDRLTDDEVLAMIFLLLSAGHETTVNLIGSGVLALLEHPDQLALLRREPSRIKTAIEELARYVVPAEMATERYAREDTIVAGSRIPRGEMVLAVIGSANRDPAYFDDPDRLDIARTNNRHLSFGHGLHYCLGAPLSRMEAQIAIAMLVERAPGLRLTVAPGKLRWRPGFIVRGLESLPVSL